MDGTLHVEEMLDGTFMVGCDRKDDSGEIFFEALVEKKFDSSIEADRFLSECREDSY